MFLNDQSIEPQVLSDQLDVVKIWDTLQGEGPYAGWPAVFVRLGGCNIRCPLCDTDYTTGRTMMSVGQVLDEIGRYDRKLVVLTGGEPFRQDIDTLCHDLLECGYFVQVETNGTLWLKPKLWIRPGGIDGIIWDRVTIVCSPKTPKLNPKILPYIDAYKYVVAYGEIDVVDGLPKSVLGRDGKPARPHDGAVPVYIQPCDEGDEQANKRNLDVALEVAMKYDYILSLQQHKLLGME